MVKQNSFSLSSKYLLLSDLLFLESLSMLEGHPVGLYMVRNFGTTLALSTTGSRESVQYSLLQRLHLLEPNYLVLRLPKPYFPQIRFSQSGKSPQDSTARDKAGYMANYHLL